MKSLFKKSAGFLFIFFAVFSIYGQNTKPEKEYGKEMPPKVFSADGALFSRKIIQNRKITEYYDGGNFRCGIYGFKNECDYRKIREFIWRCLSEKTLGYLSIDSSTVDASYTEHIFIEPNKMNQWQIIRRAEKNHAVLRINKIENLSVPFSVERAENKEEIGEWILILKDKSGKVIDEY